MSLKTIGQKLQHLRDTRHENQSTVALALKVSQQTLSAYEAGLVNISFAKLEKLAKYYNVPVDWLVQEDAEEAQNV